MKDDEMERARARKVLEDVISCGLDDNVQISANHAVDAMIAFAQQAEGSITDDEAFVWRWVERAIYDRDIPSSDALNVLAHYPGAPWNRMRWNVDHKPYAAQFYQNHPAAMLDVAPIPGS